MSNLDLDKQDMTVVYRDRTFAPRADREGQEWRGITIEHRTPPCVATAEGFVVTTVDAAGERRGVTR
jgi:hypothetical protein